MGGGKLISRYKSYEFLLNESVQKKKRKKKEGRSKIEANVKISNFDRMYFNDETTLKKLFFFFLFPNTKYTKNVEQIAAKKKEKA